MDKHRVLYEKVMKWARNNQGVRLVEMNGSRVNPCIEPDDFQDFDIVFYVSDFVAFLKELSWLESLGPVLLKQTSDDQDEPIIGAENAYITMVQFEDGTRVDLTVVDIEAFRTFSQRDSLSKIVMDKDGRGEKQAPDESSYYVEPLTEEAFMRSLNQFYWMVPYVAKGVARGHVFYALKSFDILRIELERVLDWWIASCHKVGISVGKGKHRYGELLPPHWLERYSRSYCSADEAQIRDALFQAVELFDEVAKELSKIHRIEVAEDTKDKVLDFVKRHYGL